MSENGFKFKIGDLVTAAAAMAIYRTEMGMKREGFAADSLKWAPPSIMTVQERVMVECPGGIQYFYVCRPWNGARHPEVAPVQFNEVEIEAYDMNAWLDEWQKAVSEAKADQGGKQ